MIISYCLEQKITIIPANKNSLIHLILNQEYCFYEDRQFVFPNNIMIEMIHLQGSLTKSGA